MPKYVKYAEGTAEPIKPVRADYADISDEEFAEVVAQYELEKREYDEAKAGFTGKNTEDEKNGPGAKGWVNPDSITGPGVGLK